MLRTFGGLELLGSKVTRQRPLLLLAYLVGNGGRMLRTDLWKGFYSPRVDQSDNLTTDLGRLRRGLPDCVIADGVHLQANVPSDLQEFRELLRTNRVREAVERYRGPFLHGFSLPRRGGRESAVDGSVETWVHSVRRETADAVLGSLVVLMRQALARHDEAEAGTYAEQASEIVWDAEADPETVGLIQLALEASKSVKAMEFAEQVRSYGLQLSPVARNVISHQEPEGGSSLPVRLSSFEGRRAEMLDLMQRLRERSTRLITITGAGGIGKSRLALELARSAEEQRLFEHGVLHLDLQDVRFTGLVAVRLAGALGTELKVEEDAWRQVARALKARTKLLVLDHVDHLTELGAALLGFMRECRGVHVVATGRRPLSLEGGTVFRLSALPSFEGWSPSADEHDALSLFQARAREVDPSFSLDDTNRGLVGAICDLVEGSPLGIEWAAGRLASQSLTSLATDLSRSQDALAARLPDVPARHLDPAALFEASWRSLDAAAQEAVASLSVFEGGFSREAAGAVASVELPMLTSLVEASVLVHVGDERYDFQPLLRQQAEKRLRMREERLSAVEARFRAYFLRIVKDLRQTVGSRRYGAAASALSMELRNVRRAWRSEEEPQALYDFAVGLAPFLERRGLWDEQLELGTKALEQDGEHAEAAAVHYMLATVRHNRGELTEAGRHLRTALERAEDPRLRAEVLNAVGGLHYQLRELDAARENFESARAAFAELGAEAPLTTTINNLAAVEFQLGNIPAGLSHWEEALRLQQLAGDALQQARTHNNIGIALRAQGDLDAAAIHFDKALVLRQRAHDTVGGLITQANLAGVRYEQGDFGRAAHIYRQLLTKHESMGDRASQALTLNDMATIDEQLGRFEAARERLLEAELIQDEIQDATNLATTLNNLALVELSADEPRRAAVYAQRAHALAERTGNHAASVYALVYRAAARILLDEPHTAFDLLDRATVLATDLNLKSARIQALLWTALAHAGVGAVEAAAGYAQEAVTLARELGHRPAERRALRELVRLTERRGFGREAVELLNRLIELDVALRHPDLEHDRAWLHEVAGKAGQRELDASATPPQRGKAES